MRIQSSDFDPGRARLSRIIGAGDYWLEKVGAGEHLRIVDLEGNQSADVLFYCASDPGERYSVSDTLRENGNVYLGLGSKLVSNEGRVMLEITADLVGRHDTLGGCMCNGIEYRSLRSGKAHYARLSGFMAAGDCRERRFRFEQA
jgi:uncharacterized protein